MQIAGPGNRANPLHIVLSTCLCPFRTTIRNRPATQAAAQAIKLARLLLLSERRGPISRVGNIKPRVGMSILLASILITIPRAHRRRLSSVLKPLREDADHRDILAIKRTAFPAWHMESDSTSSPPSRKQHGRNAQQRNQNPAENAARGPLFRPPMEGNPALRPQNRRSQISSTPNSPFRPNNMPAMRPPCGISWQKRPNKTQRKV